MRAALALLARALIVGAVAGATTLGVLGRAAMWGFATLTDRPPHITLAGTLTVVMAGAIAGALTAPLVLLVVHRLLPRARPALRGLALGGLALLLLSPGVRPPQPLTFALFAPAFLAYGVLLAAAWRRVLTSALAPASEA